MKANEMKTAKTFRIGCVDRSVAYDLGTYTVPLYKHTNTHSHTLFPILSPKIEFMHGRAGETGEAGEKESDTGATVCAVVRCKENVNEKNTNVENVWIMAVIQVARLLCVYVRVCVCM